MLKTGDAIGVMGRLIMGAAEEGNRERLPGGDGMPIPKTRDPGVGLDQS
jgi:hypothetical protein